MPHCDQECAPAFCRRAFVLEAPSASPGLSWRDKGGQELQLFVRDRGPRACIFQRIEASPLREYRACEFAGQIEGRRHAGMSRFHGNTPIAEMNQRNLTLKPACKILK